MRVSSLTRDTSLYAHQISLGKKSTHDDYAERENQKNRDMIENLVFEGFRK